MTPTWNTVERKGASFPNDIKLIDEFKRDYSAEKAIWWYTRECFIYQMLNTALRLLEADIIVNMGFFIHDLHRQIEQLHREQVGQYGGKTFNLYRGQGLSTTDFVKLKNTQGGLLSFNSFVSTTKDRERARFLADSSSYAKDKVGILFVMTIDSKLDSSPFADIDPFSYFDDKEDEVLFTMHSVFRINRVEGLDDSGPPMEVRLTLTADDDPELRLVTEAMEEQSRVLSGWNRIGRLLISMGRAQKAGELYTTLLDQASSESDRASCNHHLGSVEACSR